MSLSKMFTLTPCSHCEGSGCDRCDFTGFPHGCVPPEIRARLIADGLDVDANTDALRWHPANQEGSAP